MSEQDLKNLQYDSNSKYMQYARENDDDYDINKENPDLFDNLIINMISILTREINKNNIELSIKTSTLNKFEKKIYEKNIYPKIQININPIYINIKKVAEEMLLSDDEVIEIFSNLIMHYIVIYTKGFYCQSRIFNDILIGNGFVKLRVCNI